MPANDPGSFAPFSMQRSFLPLLALAAGLLSLSGTPPTTRTFGTPPPFLASPTPWADSVFSTLSLDERIAQLMMVAAYSNKGREHVRSVDRC